MSKLQAKLDVEAQLRLNVQVAKKAAAFIFGKRSLGTLYTAVTGSPGAVAALTINDNQRHLLDTMPAHVTSSIRSVPGLTAKLHKFHAAFIRQCANKFAAKIGKTDCHNVAELVSEASVAFILAARAYSKNFRFLTFAGKSMNRAMKRFTSRRKGVNEELIARFGIEEQKLAVAGERHDFHAVTEKMGITSKTRRALLLGLQQPLNEAELDNRSRHDRTQAGGLAALVQDRTLPGLDYDLAAAIAAVKLSDLERDSFMASVPDLFPGVGTLVEVAARLQVSVQAAAYAKERAAKKLRQHLRPLIK